MGVGSAISEGIDGRDRPFFIRWPRRYGSWHLQTDVLEIDVRVRIIEMQIRWDLAVVSRQSGLDQACNSGTCFQVSDVGFTEPT